VEGGVELNGADKGDGASGFEVALDRSEEMVDVDANIHENIESLDLRDVDRDEA
jgi:hypothetical protein